MPRPASSLTTGPPSVITDPATKAKLAEFGHQPYIATAPLLYVFVIDEHRNARIAERKGVSIPLPTNSISKYSYRFTQAQNDAVLALHAMETAAYSLGLGCVILGSLLNNIPGLIDVLNLPEYTLSGAGSQPSSKPDQNPTVKPRMPRTMQFFENTYPADADGVLDQLPAFDEEVHRYYDLRQADRPVDAFSDQVATISRQDVSHQTLLDKAAAQGFRLDQLETRTNEIASDRLVTESSRSPALRRLSSNYLNISSPDTGKIAQPSRRCRTINKRSHIGPIMRTNQRPVLQENPPNQRVFAPVVGIDCMWPQ